MALYRDGFFYPESVGSENAPRYQGSENTRFSRCEINPIVRSLATNGRQGDFRSDMRRQVVFRNAWRVAFMISYGPMGRFWMLYGPMGRIIGVTQRDIAVGYMDQADRNAARSISEIDTSDRFP